MCMSMIRLCASGLPRRLPQAAAASPSPYPPSSKDFSTVPIKDIPEANSVADVKAAILQAKVLYQPEATLEATLGLLPLDACQCK